MVAQGPKTTDSPRVQSALEVPALASLAEYPGRVRVKASAAWLLDRPIAHRGLHSLEHCENSLSAFREAVAQNLPIELDVHLTLDNQVVVFHDVDLTRMCGVSNRVQYSHASELRRYPLLDSQDVIPTLGEVLEVVRGQVPILIEVKDASRPQETVTALKTILKSYRGEFALQSFNPRIVKSLKKHLPNAIVGLLSGSFESSDQPALVKLLLRKLTPVLLVRPHFVSYELSLLRTWPPQLWRGLGGTLITWTVRNSEQQDCAAKSAANYIFEDPNGDWFDG